MGNLVAHLLMLLPTLVETAPGFVQELEAAYSAIAKGEGGAQKVANVAAALGQISGTVQSVAAAAK